MPVRYENKRTLTLHPPFPSFFLNFIFLLLRSHSSPSASTPKQRAPFALCLFSCRSLQVLPLLIGCSSKQKRKETQKGIFEASCAAKLARLLDWSS